MVEFEWDVTWGDCLVEIKSQIADYTAGCTEKLDILHTEVTENYRIPYRTFIMFRDFKVNCWTPSFSLERKDSADERS